MRSRLSDCAPPYLRQLFVSASSIPDRRLLCSTSRGKLVVPPNRKSAAQHRSFPVVSPDLRKKLSCYPQLEFLGFSLPQIQKRLKNILSIIVSCDQIRGAFWIVSL